MLEQASAQQKLENQALEASPSFQEAKTRLAAARKALDDLEQSMADTIRADPKFLAAKGAVDYAMGRAADAQRSLAAAR